MKTHIIAIASIAGLCLTPAAFASDKFEFDFEFSPVEVSNETGAETIYEELEKMIEEKCEPKHALDKFRDRANTEKCVDITLETTVAELDNPDITAVHKTRRG